MCLKCLDDVCLQLWCRWTDSRSNCNSVTPPDRSVVCTNTHTHTGSEGGRIPVVFTSVSNNDSVDVKNRSRSSYWVLKHRVCGINTVAKHAQNNFIHHTK